MCIRNTRKPSNDEKEKPQILPEDPLPKIVPSLNHSEKEIPNAIHPLLSKSAEARAVRCCKEIKLRETCVRSSNFGTVGKVQALEP